MKAETEALFLLVSAAINGLRVNNPRHEEGKAALAAIRAHIEEQDAEIERLREALTVNIKESSAIGDGLMLNNVCVRLGIALHPDSEEWFIEALVDEAVAKIADLATIRSTLSEVLGVKGEAVELANRAVNTMLYLVANTSPLDCKRIKLHRSGFRTCHGCEFEEESMECLKARVRDAAIDAAKGGADAE